MIYKFIALDAYIRKGKRSQNFIYFSSQKSKKMIRKINPKKEKRRKLQSRINEIEKKKAVGKKKISGTASWFFRKKTDETLAKLTNRNREKVQIMKIRNKTEAIPKDSSAIKRIIREHCEKLYTHKFDSLEEMEQFLKIYILPTLKQEKIK